MVEGTARYLVRLARRDELAQLPALEMAAAERFRGSAHPGAAEGSPISVALHTRWLGHEGVWVAETDCGEIAGFAAWVPLGRDMFVVELDVHPGHAGQRLGAQLLDALSGLGAKLGFERLVLRTYCDVPWNAPYYERLGFSLLGETEEHPELASIREHEVSVGLDTSHRSTLSRDIRA